MLNLSLNRPQAPSPVPAAADPKNDCVKAELDLLAIPSVREQRERISRTLGFQALRRSQPLHRLLFPQRRHHRK